MHREDKRASLEALEPGANGSAPWRAETEDQHVSLLHQRLLNDFNDEELAEIGVNNGEAITKSLLDYSEHRSPGKSLVRIYNPTQNSDGWSNRHTVIEIVCDERPFVVDTILGELSARNLFVYAVSHPMMDWTRNADGKREALPSYERSDETQPREIVIHIQTDQLPDQDARIELVQRIEKLLRDVETVVSDFDAMLRRLDGMIEHLEQNPAQLPEDEIYEANAFLHWLRDNHFSFLGSREYDLTGDLETGDLVPVEGTSLGVLRDPNLTILRRVQNKSLTPERREFMAMPVPLLITKSNTQSHIHRRVHMDYVGIKRFDENGQLCGECRFVGLFTAEAYNESVLNIPLLSRRVRKALGSPKQRNANIAYRDLLNIVEKFPRDELFQLTEDEICRSATRIRDIYERPKTRLLLRPDRFDRYASALVYVPRDRYSSDVRERISDCLVQAFNGRLSAYYPYFDDSTLARVHMIIGFDERPPESAFDEPELERQISEITQTWSDRLEIALRQQHTRPESRELLSRYHNGFPASYTEHTSTREAVTDIAVLETLPAYPEITVRYSDSPDEQGVTKFKLYRAQEAAPLSDIVPILENMGFKILHEQGYRISREDDCIWIHEFSMNMIEVERAHGNDVYKKLEDTFIAVWSSRNENDAFNKLVARQSLSWRYVGLLRALSRYLRLIGLGLSKQYTVSVLNKYPKVTGLIVQLFKEKFEPEAIDRHTRENRVREVTEQLTNELDAVESLDEDQIFRQLINLIESIWRTNFFQLDAKGEPKSYASFKISSQNVQGMPLPKPFAEIFTYAPDVEGIHIRFGKVARGGLRWSDRREDYRTEVLGLVKAQKVKNAVIVPVGSKGGFVPRKLNGNLSREESQRIGIEAYKTFISSLLDVTDNVENGQLITPPKVLAHDENDPYLVVAADKGTATFSDIANSLSADYGFWLDDAFASGGSNGYDHKKMGITARGAWEAVKRHFREEGKDIQNESFTVAGVGDMSGDVFGNGMLLSEKIQLVAAFDHRHIFIDPNPDPDTSFKERRRLFDLPRSSWADYNTDLISDGGGIFSRTLKSIRLSAEIKSALDLDTDAVTPHQLMRAILRAPVELMWFGGIGTYIKSEDEHDTMVGDRANDAIRVGANEVRAKVIGEGANLGITQRGRISFAMNGGRINTDAIDNSAGVDCSDHEVNIKILLTSAMKSGGLTVDERNQLLVDMTDEVASLVLENNYEQTLTLSLAQQTGQRDIDSYKRLITDLEQDGVLDREVEVLPNDEELSERVLKDECLTRPEMSVLLAYSKLQIFEDICSSDYLSGSDLDEEIINYFPSRVRDKYRTQITGHQLRREIIATVLSNRIVNYGGITFVNRASDVTGAGTDEIVRAFVIVDRIFAIGNLRSEINRLDNTVPSKVQWNLHGAVMDFLRRQVNWFLRTRPVSARTGIAGAVDIFQSHVQELAANVCNYLTQERKERVSQHKNNMVEAGVPSELATKIATLDPLRAGCDICRLTEATGFSVADVATAYFEIGHQLDINACRDQSIEMKGAEHWDRLTLRRATESFDALQYSLAGSALAYASTNGAKAEITSWMNENQADISRAHRVIETLSHSGDWTVSKIMLAESELRQLAEQLRK